ncbi:unnamed protein product [Closterium sp. Naga37s-1]|nr:unnamed protein product [Closterium sp. Naga37s-1]
MNCQTSPSSIFSPSSLSSAVIAPSSSLVCSSLPRSSPLPRQLNSHLNSSTTRSHAASSVFRGAFDGLHLADVFQHAHLAVALVRIEQEGAALVMARTGGSDAGDGEPGSAATPPARDSAGAAQRRAGPGRALSSSLLTALTALTFSLGVLQHRLHEAALVRLKGELDRDGRSSELITNPSSRPSTSPTSPSSSKSPSSPVRKGRGKKAAAQQSALEQLCTDLTAMVAQGEIDPSHPTLPQPTLPHSSLSHHQPAAQQSALEQFCTDLTAMAVQGGIDPVIGREEEVARVIPAHRTSNNQLLLGEPGVGKTALDPCSSHREQPSAAGRARGGKTAISPFSMPLFVLSSPLSLFHSPALLSCSLPPQIQARRTKNNPLLLGELGVGKTAMYSPLFTQPLPPVSHLPILAFSPSPPPQILARCTKNNPLLLGEPGVGKTAIAEGLALRIAENDVPPFLQVRGHVAGVEMGTAIAEGLALRIAENDVPPFLQVSGVVLRREWVDRGTGCIAKGLGKAAVGEGLAGKRLRSLDMGRVMAGAKERGELELRVTMLVAEAVAAAGEVILLIDEVHTMVGAGAVGRGRDGGGSGLDISNLLKPALSRGQIQLEPQEGDEAGGGSASDISNLLKTALTRGKIQCISTTTTNEFCEHLEKDKALASHLMHSHLPPPSPPARLHSNPSLTHLLLLNHQCIATTTTNEFCKHLEKDKALARRFQPVTVDEPSEALSTRDSGRALRGEWDALLSCAERAKALAMRFQPLTVEEPSGVSGWLCFESTQKFQPLTMEEPSGVSGWLCFDSTQKFQPLTMEEPSGVSGWLCFESTQKFQPLTMEEPSGVSGWLCFESTQKFQPLTMEEPSGEAALAILHGLRHLYEAHHKCTLTDDTLAAAVTLYACFIPDRCLPDRAIDLIDKAASRSRVEGSKGRRRRASGVLERGAEEYWREIRMAQAAHEAVRMGAMRASKREACRSKVEGSKGRRRRVSGVLERGAEEYWREIRMAQAAHEACGSRAAAGEAACRKALTSFTSFLSLCCVPSLLICYSSSVPLLPFSLALLLLRSLAPAYARQNPFTSLTSFLSQDHVHADTTTAADAAAAAGRSKSGITGSDKEDGLTNNHTHADTTTAADAAAAAGRSKSGITGSDKEDSTTAADAATAAGQSRSGITGSDKDDSPTEITAEHIAAVAAHWTGIPLQQLSLSDQQHLAGLEEALETRVVGQGAAVRVIARAVQRARVGLKGEGRPVAALLFSGPTGVGKTELCKALAAHYYGSEDSMIRLDMSEYMERHAVSKLIGAPPGYVGYGEGGKLTEAVRRRPFCLILLDEIEKAHPDVFNLLLQIFEDGRLTDSQGRHVSFKNALIVLTSNVGSQAIARGGTHRIGFLTPGEYASADGNRGRDGGREGRADAGRYAAMKEVVMEELKAHFRPELMNRIDEVVVFRALEREQYAAMREVVMEELKVHFRPELMNRIDVVVVFRALERGTAQVGRYAAMRDVVVEELKMHFRPALMNWIDEVVVFRALERGTAMREMVVEELKGHFRPELINRIDEVVVFRTLEKEQIRVIANMMVKESADRLAQKGINLEISEVLMERICEEGYDRAYGARPLRCAVTRLVDDPISEAVLAAGESSSNTRHRHRRVSSSDLSESLPSVPSLLLPAIAADAKEDDTSAPLGDVSGVREGAFTAGDTALVDVGEDGEPVVIRLPRPDVCEMGLCLPFLKLPAAAAPTLSLPD